MAGVWSRMETRRGGALQVWLPPVAGKEYWWRWIRRAAGRMGTSRRCR